LQLWIAHTPLLQLAVAFGRLQIVVQSPQCMTSVIRFDSQPSLTSALQSRWPAAQVTILHAPPEQVPVPFGGAQDLPQAPQCCRLVPRSISQPSAGSPLQSPKPGAQLTEQVPLAQDATPLVELQILPQPPQFAVSVVSRASHPSGYLPLQSAKPVEQVSTTQAELTHLPSGPLATTHMFRQLPQFSASVVVLASHPFLTSPSQLPYPVEQLMLQTP